MRNGTMTLVAVLAVGFLAGCPAKPSNGFCKTSDDCAAQAGFGKVCVAGHCQECALDGDCKAGFACRSNLCTPRPECDPGHPCADGKACQAGRCVAVSPPPECTADASCGAGKACRAGKCVTAEPLTCPPGGGKLIPIHFAYDKALLTPESQSELARNAACIRTNSFTHVTVEGNCDERGTVEYNLQLGQRRAEAARKYLINLGIPAKAIQTISYGKERPICTEATDACWQKNRRDDIVAK